MTISFLALVVSGWAILMVHPRLYWGETGNDLTPALFELPISRNYQHGGWKAATPFFEEPGSAVSASRTYEIFNQNSWGRSLHFLAAWLLVLPGVVYLLLGLLGGHFRLNLFPQPRELNARSIGQEIKDHLRFRAPPATNGPRYGLLQKCTYCSVIFIALPVATLTGLAMSPAITASYPILSAMFGGAQSARTIHFFASVLLLLFLLVHVSMVIRSGFKRQMRAMTLGN